MVRNHNPLKDGRRVQCSTENYVQIVVPGLSTGSSSSATPTSPKSLPQMGHSSHEPAETENTNKNEDNETVRRNPLRGLPEWLEDFAENLVDESVPAHRDAPASSSRELASEPRVKVVSGSGKQSINNHFPKDKDCEICKRTKITRSPCRKRSGTAVPRAEKLW